MRISSVVPTILISASLCASAQTVEPGYTPPPTCKATQPPAVVAGPQMSQYAADRENAMATANLALTCRDFEAAYQRYLKVLEVYPDDARAIQSAAHAAVLAGHDDAAITLYKRTFQPGARYTSSAHTTLMQIYIRLGRWDDFQAERVAARASSLDGTLTMSRDEPFPIENLHASQEFFDVYEFPTLYGPNHTRDRFDLQNEKDICTEFTPYIDLVASDAGAEATYSLLAFPAPATQWLIKTYPKGEPHYQTVRADVLSAMSTPLTTYKPPAPCRTPAPTASNGGLSANAAR